MAKPSTPINELCNDIRKRIVGLSYSAGKNSAHIGGSLSAVEILVTLYHRIMRIGETDFENRDRFILSKGHSALALYCVLESAGLIPVGEIDSFETNGSRFTAHARKDLSLGIEFSGGSLGLGLSYATGMAYACKAKALSARVFTLVGDGECNEGIVWESLLFAHHHQLDNFTVIVDCNRLQADGFTRDILDTGSLEDKFAAFGFHPRSVDGHSVAELENALLMDAPGPKAVIARTTKGKGISFMEDKYNWHFASLSEARYKKAIQDLEAIQENGND